MRLLSFSFCGLIVLGVLTVAAHSLASEPVTHGGDPVTLQTRIVMDSDMVTLGDLFSGAGTKAETPVAYAPRPGRRAHFGARWLYRLARAYGLDWKPLSKHTQVIVERRSIVIGRDEITDTLMSAFDDRGIGDDLDISLANSMVQMHVPTSTLATISVDDLSYDSRSKRFTAILSAPAGHPNAERIRVTGHLVNMTEIPVLARRLLPGEIIGAADITYKKIRSDRLRKDGVLDAESMIGKAAIRTIREGKAIRINEIRRPFLVKKGDLVTLVFEARGMQLTAQGKALENGSERDSIRVSNLQSSQVVDAIVTATGRVSVSLANQLALSR